MIEPAKPTLRVIPREQHGISRRNISNGALRVLYRLNEAGYDAFLVGGAVRDLLLGGHPKDFDIATNATPEQVRGLFRNCRLIGRRFRLAHVVFGQEIVEVATFRGTGEEGNVDRHVVDGRIVRDNVYGTIEEDAIRRDFRVNALYYNIADFSVRDYVGGMEDLDKKVLHLIGDPDQRYREDPVRMLRAVRLAAKLGFSIDQTAQQPFAHLGQLLCDAAPARLFDESLKLFLAGHGQASFRELDRSGLLGFVFPATAAALRHSDGAEFRALVEWGLKNTDQRVKAEKSVTPAFLFAVLLWGAVRERVERGISSGMDPAAAWANAGGSVIAEQSARVAIPRRFSLVMEEIWSLQPRFELRMKKRVFRLLAHPRFRAAYDFLVVRAQADNSLKPLVEWWGQAHAAQPDALDEMLNQAAQPAAALPKAGAPKKRRRRRRKKAPGGGSGDAPEAT
ncbi:polynucleotide adenylyltransferase PcnB [Tahibacter amnicola]|uniref:Poly(A) polymerase I n=1 Tax=Tahibacter amnicola TaxID=2976241 RepID=A0ABY6BCJ4_9GAMM|nr:polynucleotide adenylyltransferase PcnB [Tahibacter amnicola]UXI66913.1 polynucleotide adenylyltransferase PcnB [Tahibacter amnicola]